MPGSESSMHWEQQIQYASLSDVGFRRRNNEDACIARLSRERETWERCGHLFLVADGMGGHAAGELASKIAIDTIPHTYFKSRLANVAEALRASIETANAAIHEQGTQNRDFHRMGTTCAALILSADGAFTGHVGDSRVYRIRGQQIEQLTRDHSLQWELEQRGQLLPEHLILHEASHVITRSLGPERSVQVDITGPIGVRPGDVFLLCSDGLTAHLEDREIGVIANELPVQEACRTLVHLANLRGGSDNITVIVARVGDLTSPELSLPVARSEREVPTVSGKTLLALWSVAGLFAASVVLLLLREFVAAATVAALTVLALLVLAVKQAADSSTADDTSESSQEPSQPIPAVRFKLQHQFLSQLGELESELHKTAVEESWSIDWPAQESAHAAAREALREGRYAQTLSALGRSIDALMVGVHAHRRQIVHEARWGKEKASDD